MYSTWAISGVDRAVYGWGLAVGSSATPIRLVDPGPWLTLASGASESHVCGIKTDNTAWCWCAIFYVRQAFLSGCPCPELFHAHSMQVHWATAVQLGLGCSRPRLHCQEPQRQCRKQRLPISVPGRWLVGSDLTPLGGHICGIQLHVRHPDEWLGHVLVSWAGQDNMRFMPMS